MDAEGERNMTDRSALLQLGAALSVLVLGGAAGASPIGFGYTVSSIEVASGPGAGGAGVFAAGAVFVGVGDQGPRFPPSSEGALVIRIDDPGLPGQTETVVADGFTSLSGFATDGSSLWVGDNGLEFVDGGVTDPTGDTLYRIIDLDPLSPAAARDLEILMEGSLPGIQDVDVLGARVFANDAVDFKLYELTGGVITELASLPGFAGGIATDGTTLYNGQVEGSFPDTEGTLRTLDPIAPGSLALLLDGLAGQFDIEVLPDGSLIASSGSEIVHIDLSGPTPVVTTIASGFGFATGLFAADDGTIYALDGFAAPGEENNIWVFTLVPEPGSASLLGLGLLAIGVLRRSGAAASLRGRGV